MTIFQDKVALVVGADSAVGQAIAQRLAAEGARVFVTAVDAGVARACADAIRGAGGMASSAALDVLSEAGWIAAIAAAGREWGRLDMLVTCIGDAGATPMMEVTLPDFTTLFDTNVLGPWLGLKHAITAMRAAGKGGAIVTVAAAGLRTPGGLGATTVHGLRMMTRSAAVECGAAKDGIRVNAIEAGMTADASPVQPADVASAVRHLLSREASFTTGSTLVVAGASVAPPLPAYAPRDEGSLRGKVAMVTGATSGLGRACAVSLAKRGVRLVLTGRNVERGQETLDLVRAAGGDGLVVRHDVTVESDWRNVLRQATAAFGPLDILVNNAGDRRPAKIEAATYADAFYILRVNVHSTFLGMKHGASAMPARGGVMLNMSSIGGMHGSVGNVDYSAAKAMVTFLSQVAAAELAPRGIRVVPVNPGVYFTEGFYRNRPDPVQAERDKKGAATSIPIGHSGDVADFGEAMAFLVSDEARAMTGSNFVTDGGTTA